MQDKITLFSGQTEIAHWYVPSNGGPTRTVRRDMAAAWRECEDYNDANGRDVYEDLHFVAVTQGRPRRLSDEYVENYILALQRSSTPKYVDHYTHGEP